jgi:hypothetical protein
MPDTFYTIVLSVSAEGKEEVEALAQRLVFRNNLEDDGLKIRGWIVHAPQ